MEIRHEIEMKLSYGTSFTKETKMILSKFKMLVHWWIQTYTDIVDLYCCLEGPNSAVNLKLEVGNFWKLNRSIPWGPD